MDQRERDDNDFGVCSSDAADPTLNHGAAALVEVRRTTLLEMLLAVEAVRTPLLVSIVSLLEIPDSGSAKKALNMVEHLCTLVGTSSTGPSDGSGGGGSRHFGAHATSLLVPLGREAFVASLKVLLNNDKWSSGLEWEYLGYMEQVYTALVPETQNSNPGTEGLSGVWVRPQADGSSHSLPPLPRQVLLTLPGMPAMAVQALEQKLNSQKTKKKRRDSMRDFIKQYTEQCMGCGRGDAGADSASGTAKNVTNLPPLHSRISTRAAQRSQVPSGTAAFDSSLTAGHLSTVFGGGLSSVSSLSGLFADDSDL